MRFTIPHHQLILALGSNLGDRHANLMAAKQQVGSLLKGEVIESTLIETPAWGRTDQPDFLNQVIAVELSDFLSGLPLPLRGEDVALTLHRLLDLIQSIEHALGRSRKLHWGPRTVDLDLILLGDLRYEDERISLPHPWWRVRDFVRPLVEEISHSVGD